jgi:hypothetical protein
LGHSAGSNLIDGEGNIYISAQVQACPNEWIGFIRIGDDTAFAFPYGTFIAGIFDRVVHAGTFAFVLVDDTGKLGTHAVDANGNKVALPSPKVTLNDSSTRKRGRGIGRYGCASRGNGQRAGRANPKSERPAWSQ